MQCSRLPAAGVLLAMLGAASPVHAAADEWTHTAYVYMVGAGIDGKAGLGGVTADVDVNFGDILDSLEFSTMGGYRGERGPWAVVADLNYLRVEQRKDGIGPFGQTRATVDADQLVFELDGSYALDEHWSVYGALRYWRLDVDLQVVGGGPLGETLARSGDEQWVDPVVGARYVVPLSQRWSLIAKGDIGGFGVGSDFSWQAVAFANWSLNEHANVQLGFRYIDVDYEDGTSAGPLRYDVTLGGPAAGFAWRF
jgi:hypothetical protein